MVSRKMKIIAGVTALLIIGGAAAALAIGIDGPAVEVETAKVEKEDLAVTVTASGRVESGGRVDVFPSTAGIIESVEVEDGQEVTAGTILAKLDTGPLKLQVAQAKAGLAQAEAQTAAISKQKPTSVEIEAARRATGAAWKQYQAARAAVRAAGQQAPTQADRSAANAATIAARTAYLSAESGHQDIKEMHDLAPTPELAASLGQAELAKDRAYAGYLQAKAAQDKLAAYDGTAARLQAQAAAAQAHSGYTALRAQQLRLEGTDLSVERRAAQAAVDQAREALVIAQENYEEPALVAPVNGRVLFNALGAPAADGQVARVTAGAAVAPQSAPFTVVDLGALRFTAEVDEADVDRVKSGMTSLVKLDAFSGEAFESTVSRILSAATLTPTGGTVFPVHFKLNQGAANLLIGMKGDVTIEVDSVPGATTIPIEALFDEGGQNYVYVVGGDDTLVRTPITIDTLTETRVEVVTGVEPGDTVALSGPVELVDGMRVRAQR